jgi:WD40 repeat protein
MASIWNSQTGEVELSTNAGEGAITSASYLPDGRTLVAALGTRTIRLSNATTGDRFGELPVTAAPNCVAYAPDLGLLAASCQDGSVAVWTADGRSHVWYPPFLAVQESVANELQYDKSSGAP